MSFLCRDFKPQNCPSALIKSWLNHKLNYLLYPNIQTTKSATGSPQVQYRCLLTPRTFKAPLMHSVDEVVGEVKVSEEREQEAGQVMKPVPAEIQTSQLQRRPEIARVEPGQLVVAEVKHSDILCRRMNSC